MGFLSSLGQLASQTGTKLGLPEMHVSETLGYHPNDFVKAHFGPVSPQVLADPTSTDGGTPTDTSSGGGATYSTNSVAPTVNLASLAAINDQINRLGNQQTIGTDNINRSYQAGYDSLYNGQQQAQGQYDTTKSRSQQDNVDTKAQIDTGVRNGLTGLQRLLGAAGAGNSSAARVLAPYAAGFEGNQQRQQVNKTYDRNMSDLDTGWNATQNQYKEKFGSLESDKQNKLNSLLQNLAATRANLLAQKQQVSGGNYTADINALNNQVDSLGQVSVFDPGKVDYTPAAQGKYTYDQAQAPTSDPNQAGAASNLGVYNYLLKDKKQGAIA
jgi:hypothetical protein